MLMLHVYISFYDNRNPVEYLVFAINKICLLFFCVCVYVKKVTLGTIVKRGKFPAQASFEMHEKRARRPPLQPFCC